MAQTQINGATQIRAASIPWAQMATGAIVPTASLVDGAKFIKSDGTVNMAAALNLNSNLINNVSPPVAATDAANKAYVDAAISGFKLHGAKAVAIANSVLTGLITIDGYTTLAGDTVLLTAQTVGSQNGPWVVASGAWARPTWWAAAAVISEGNYFIIDPDGTTYKNTKWFITTAGNITVDTTSITFTQDLSGTVYSASNGLQLVGTVFSPVYGNGVANSAGSITAVGNAANLITVGASGIGITPSTSAAQLMLGNASNVPTWTSMSGDVTIAATGVATINNTAGSGFVKYTNFINSEIPGGSINGINTAFTLANTPANGNGGASTLELYLNGVLLQAGAGNDYTLSAASITMLLVPQTGDKIEAIYIK